MTDDATKASDVSAQLDAAAHNALHATHRAAAATSDFYGRQLMAKQQEVFALRDRVATLTADNAKLFGWEERAKQLEAAYNELLTKCSTLITDAAFASAGEPSPLVVPAAAESAAATLPAEPVAQHVRKHRKRR